MSIFVVGFSVALYKLWYPMLDEEVEVHQTQLCRCCDTEGMLRVQKFEEKAT